MEIAHVAHSTGFTENYVRSLIDRGFLPAYRFPIQGRDGIERPGTRWRVDRADLKVFLASIRVERRDRRRGDVPANRRIQLQPRADEAAG